MKENNKRAQIYKLEFCSLDNAVIHNIPSSRFIKVSADWFDIPISTAEFTEVPSADNMIEQELKGIITDTSAINRKELEEVLADYGILRCTYTNGVQRIIGTDQFPVEVELSENGSPARYELTVNHKSASKAKIYQSF